MSSVTQKSRAPRPYSIILLEFLGSMNLAITLLVAIAIASIIGTVLKQNELYNNYIIKFGQYWFEIFRDMGLYDVYSAGWFLALLGFLLVSTSVCVYRNGPNMLRDMRHFRMNVMAKSLRLFHHHAEWQATLPLETTRENAVAVFESAGYRVRIKEQDDRTVIAAMKGGANRLGYLFTHIAIIVICIGALIDSNPVLNLGIQNGDVKILPHSVPPSKAGAESKLDVNNVAFRGTVRIPEKGAANIIFINKRDGYLIQELPFRIELEDFRIEHYATGQPKSFESDLVVYDDTLKEPLRKTIRVNEPLIHRGLAIYQASFEDGGTKLKLKLWPMNDPSLQALNLKATVFESITIESDQERFALEMTDFRKFNINPVQDGSEEEKLKNFGPNYTFKVRDASGAAKEYENYMSPIEFDGRHYFLSGVRSSQAEGFQYLYIPADKDFSLARFMLFRAKLHDRITHELVARETSKDLAASSNNTDERFINSMKLTIISLLEMYADGGLEAIGEHLKKNVPEDKRQQVANTYFRILKEAMGTLYVKVLESEGLNLDDGVSESDVKFFDDAFEAMSKLPQYGSPFYLQLKDFTHIQASGLQVTRSPAKDIVYLGCIMLIIGLFMMFYVIHRRYWLLLAPGDSGLSLVFAGMANRNIMDFDKDYKELESGMQAVLQAQSR